MATQASDDQRTPLLTGSTLRTTTRKKWRTVLASFCIVGNAITAGSIFTFPLFAPTMAKTLGLSMQQTSTIASAGILTQYLSAVAWGTLADRKGPGSVSFGSATLNVCGFWLMSSTLADAKASTLTPPGAWIWMSLFYAFVGSATAASYFSAVITSARLFPSHPGQAIGIPCAIFGLSPLFLSLLGNTGFRHVYGDEREDTFDTVGYLRMLAILLGVTNLLGAVGMRLGEHNQPPQRNVSTRAGSSRDRDEESTPLIQKPDQGPNPTALGQFLRDPAMWMLGFAILLAAGPGEMIMSSLGAIVAALVPPATTGTNAPPHLPSALALSSQHVQIISGVNTGTRLIAGWLSDRLARGHGRFRVSRLAFLGVAPVLFGVACFWTACKLEDPEMLGVLSVSTGVAYGTIFTLSPSIVATVWPLADFGRNWGLLSYFSAAGAVLYTLLFGSLFDLAAPKDGSQCVGRHCFEASFLVCGVSEVLAVGLVMLLWGRWMGKV